MISEKPKVTARKRLPVFAISCWTMALMAFFQLLIAGMALATRFEESRVVKVVTKEVPKISVIRVPAKADAAPAPAGGIVSRPSPQPLPQAPSPLQSLPPPTPVATPKIADPVTERLVDEARKARVVGDMGLAILKLEAAQDRSPEDPNVQFELGLVNEQMGVYDAASAHYEKVYRMQSDAGSLYPRAAEKIGVGFVKPDNHGKLSLGRVLAYPDPDATEGEKTVLTIPVEKAPGAELNLNDISFVAYFFYKTSQGEIVLAEDKSWMTENKWMDGSLDFAGGEDNLRMTYVIPNQDEKTEHLFGSRKYYGQVITLVYNGEILDVQAWPRELAARIPQSNAPQPLPQFQESLPGFDPSMPLLPPLPTQ